MASGLGSVVRFGQYTSFVLLVRQELQDQFRNGNEQSAAWREEFLLSLKINEPYEPFSRHQRIRASLDCRTLICQPVGINLAGSVRKVSLSPPAGALEMTRC
jgi:hypothetical protein